MDIHRIITEIASHLQRSVLATTVSVEGHAYRKEGAMMLMLENGLTVGCISPGCMEVDLLERVADVLLTNKPQIVEYDMLEADDLSWGEALGCGGKVRVLLEPVSGNLLEQMLEIKRKLDQGVEVHFIRMIDREGTRVKYKLLPLSKSLDDLKNLHGMDEKVLFFAQTFSPKPRLIVFGAGNDTQPIVELAYRFGFQIIVADWRPLLCTKERFGEAEFVVGFPKKILKQLRLNEKDYVIVMSHHLRWDSEFLQGMAQTRLKYVGIMGSRSRCELLLKEIIVPKWFHAPIGLAIGAEGPEEIAISIIAELIRVRNKSVLLNVEGTSDSQEKKLVWI
jgi:xanthine dehydrogenase accessory factor